MAPQPPPFNPSKLKTGLKMAISRLKFVQEKKAALCKQQRRQLADLLKQGKESSAQIRVENIIREDIYIELLEHLELYCELLLARISIVSDPARKECEPNLLELVLSIIYSAQHSELKELTSIRDLLIFKYGHEFGVAALANTDGHVPTKILLRCLIEPPSETLVNLYLCEIARAYEAPYLGLAEYELEEKLNDDDEDDDEPSGGIKEPIKVAEPLLELEEVRPVKFGNDFDALKARFAALKLVP